MSSVLKKSSPGAALALLLAVLCAPAWALPPVEAEGKVRFYNIADSDFDRFTKAPDVFRQAWMREHYIRMQTYSPYFDQRLAWYPDAWVYKDSYAIKPHWPEYEAHPEWILRDAEGHALYIPWGCKHGRCPQFAADVGNPAFRAHWIEQARELIGTGYRGIWIDDVNLAWRVSDGNGRFRQPIDPRTGQPMTLDVWQENFASFMEQIRAAFPDVEIAHNSIWYAGSFDNDRILRQIDAADYINLERGASDPGLKGGNGRWSFQRFLRFIDLVHARGRSVILMDYGRTKIQREYALAAWLLISEGRDLLASNQLNWTAPESFWRGYELNLGHALGPRKEWRGLIRRDFECGYALLNAPDNYPVSIALPSDRRRFDAPARNHLQLKSAEAAVIVHDCRPAKPRAAE